MQRIALILALIASISVLAGAMSSPAGADPTPTCNGTTCTVTFAYTGAAQTWTVPAGVTSATFDLYGAAGGSFAAVGALAGGSGGKGGHVQATLALTPAETLNMRVGGVGQDGATFVDTTATIAGGFNGGGTNTFSCTGCAFELGGAGGGASDVRSSGDGLADRLLAAGGGGGGGPGGANTADPGTGGDSATAAKSVTGWIAFNVPGGKLYNTCSGGGAGTLLGPGAAGSGGWSGSAGDAGGLTGGGGTANTAAGGGGYFGGGAGAGTTIAGCGGGGGSDYPDPANPPSGVSAVTVTDGVRSGNGLIEVTYTLSPVQQTSDLEGMVTSFGLPTGLTTALNSKLDAALAGLGTDKTAAACGSLQAFMNHVKAQTGKKLTAAQAQQLADAATGIRAQLGC